MANILLIYSTTDGQTLQICQRLQQSLVQQAHQVTLLPIAGAGNADLAAYDKIVLGASIRYGKHSPLVFDFVRRNAAVLDTRPNAFFTVNVVARKPEKNHPDTNPYMLKFLRLVPWKPRRLGVFAGKIDYPRLGTLDRTIIRFIMWITKGPTDTSGTFEFTDWNQVDAFAQIIADMQ